jgi:predicted RNA binding protein YcfA (HicA-like mRNA interferase family)
MPKPIPLRKVLKVLLSKGFFFVSQKGSHAKYCRCYADKNFIVIVPVHGKEVCYGTFSVNRAASQIN